MREIAFVLAVLGLALSIVAVVYALKARRGEGQ